MSRRLFALLCFLMLIFDVVGGLTTVWKNEISRVYTARLRIGVLVVALLAAAFVEFHGLGFRWVDHVEPKIVRGVFWVLMPVAGTLLALLTFGGFVAAIAVTSACGLSLQLHTALRKHLMLCPTLSSHATQGSLHEWTPPHNHEWIFAVESGCLLLVMCMLWCACGCTCVLRPQFRPSTSMDASSTSENEMPRRAECGIR